MEIRGGSRKSQGIRSHEWRSQVVPGDPRGRGPCESRGDMKEVQGISGKPLGSPREPRKSQGILGNPRKSKELGNSKETLGTLRSSQQIDGNSRGDPRVGGPWESRGDIRESQGISRKPLGRPREPGKSPGILGNPRKSKELGNSKETLGTLRSFQQIDGNSMRSQEISGIRSHDRRSQEVLGDLRGSQEFRGDPMTPRGNLGHAWRS